MQKLLAMAKPLERRKRNREYDAKRAKDNPWRAWYKAARWQKLRALQLSRQPLCERCLSRERVVEATVVHHKTAHRGDPELFWDDANLASSCADCHDIDEQRIERGGKARVEPDDTGWPIDKG